MSLTNKQRNIKYQNDLPSLESGQCHCAERVEGRQCDHCVYGAWNYPSCEACDCDTKGTTEKICDQTTSECLCKGNVEPGRCDSCKEGFYNLQDWDPLGCMECFCFGRTSECSAHQSLIQTQVSLWNYIHSL